MLGVNGRSAFRGEYTDGRVIDNKGGGDLRRVGIPLAENPLPLDPLPVRCGLGTSALISGLEVAGS